MAFHPYPQVIPPVFNPGGFGPSRGLTPASTCPWVDHSASGLRHATKRPVQTRFRSGSPSLVNLATHRNSQAHSSKGTPSRPQANLRRRSDCLWTNGFRYYFTPLTGYFSPFPHGTRALSVACTYLALRGGPRRFTPVFTVPALLGIPARGCSSFAYGSLTLCGAPFQNASARRQLCNSVPHPVLQVQVPLPRLGNATGLYHQVGLGWSPFARRYSGSRMLLSLPRGTEMFQFPRFPLPALCVQAGVTPHDGCRVSPFGDPRITAWSAAPRGLSQPPTSFIGVRRLGIHRWPLVAWKNKDARARYAVLKELGLAAGAAPPHMRTPARPGGRAGGASSGSGRFEPLPQNRRQDGRRSPGP